MLKRMVIGGWVLLALGAFLVVMLPNDQALAKILWFFSISLFVLTFAFLVLGVIRVLGKVLRSSPRVTAPEPYAPAYSSPVKGWPMVFRLLLALSGIALFVSSLLAFIEYKIRSSPVYQTSMARACESSYVVEAVGQPVRAGWFNTGTIMLYSDGRGRAKLRIPITGPKGRGILRVDAVRISGGWSFRALRFVTAGENSGVDLLHAQF